MKAQTSVVAAVAAVACLPAAMGLTIHNVTYPALNSLFREKGKMYFGTATDNLIEWGQEQYVRMLNTTQLFGALVPTNAMKWVNVQPGPNNFTFEGGDQIVAASIANQQYLRCHNLVWHSQLPDYITNGKWNKKTLTEALEFHVTSVVEHYKGHCLMWDVVNEPLNDNGTLALDSPIPQILGEDFIEIAFRAARAADPNAKLCLNDFNVESLSAKTTAYHALIRRLKAKGVDVDCMGFESHFIVGETPTTKQQVASMKSFVELGVFPVITELDIRLNLPQNASNLAQQACDYASTIGACLEVPECIGITLWDYYDPVSWVMGTFPGQGAPSLAFENFKPKPAVSAIAKAIQASTPPQLRAAINSLSSITGLNPFQR